MMEDEKRGSSYEGIRLYNPNDYLSDESRTTWSEEKSESSLSNYCPHRLSSHDEHPPQKLSSTMLLIPAKKGRFHLFEEDEYNSRSSISNETFSSGNSSPKISNATQFSGVNNVPQAQQTLKNCNYRNESFSSNATSESAAFSASGTQMLSDESITKEVTFPTTKYYDIYCSGKWSDKGCVVLSKLEDINGNKRKIFSPRYRLGKLPLRFETRPRIPVFLQSAAYDSQFEIKLTEIDEIMRKPPLPKKMRIEESYETCRIFLNPQMENESIESLLEKQDSFKIIFPEKSIFPSNSPKENISGGEDQNSSSSETDQELDILPESNNEMFKYYQSCRLEQIEDITSQVLQSEDSSGMVKTKTSWDRIKSAVFEKSFSKFRFTTSKVFPEELSAKGESLFPVNENVSSSTPSLKGKFSFKKLFKSLLRFGASSSNKELVSTNKTFKNYQILEEEVCVRYNDFEGNGVENESDKTPSPQSSVNMDCVSNKALNTSSGIRSFPLSLPEIRENRGSGSLREFYASNATSKNTNASVTDSSEGESNKCVNNGMNLSRTPILDYLNEVKMRTGNSSVTGQSSNKTLEDENIIKTDTNLNEEIASANNSVTFSTSNEEIVDDSQIQNIVQDINNNNEYNLDDCKKTDAIPEEQILPIQQKETSNANVITSNRPSFLKGVFRIFQRKEQPVIQVAHVSVKLDKETKIKFAADTPIKSKRGFFQRLFKKGDTSLPTEFALTESKNNDSASSKSFISSQNTTVNSSILSNTEQEKLEEDPLKTKHVNSVSILRKKRQRLFAETQEFYQDSMTAYKHAISRMIGNSEASASPASFPMPSRLPSDAMAAASALKSGLIIENHSLLGLGYKSTVSESVILPAMSKRKRRLHQGAILDDLLEDDINENKEEKAEEPKLKGILKNR